jgi:hypothetical protein
MKFFTVVFTNEIDYFDTMLAFIDNFFYMYASILVFAGFPPICFDNIEHLYISLSVMYLHITNSSMKEKIRKLVRKDFSLAIEHKIPR